MLKICLVFWKSEPQYAYKLHAYKKNMYFHFGISSLLTYLGEKSKGVGCNLCKRCLLFIEIRLIY